MEPNILEFIRKYAEGETDVNAFLASLSESDVSVIEQEKTGVHGKNRTYGHPFLFTSR